MSDWVDRLRMVTNLCAKQTPYCTVQLTANDNPAMWDDSNRLVSGPRLRGQQRSRLHSIRLRYAVCPLAFFIMVHAFSVSNISDDDRTWIVKKKTDRMCAILDQVRCYDNGNGNCWPADFEAPGKNCANRPEALPFCATGNGDWIVFGQNKCDFWSDITRCWE